MDLCLKKTPEGTWLVLDQDTGEILCGMGQLRPSHRNQAQGFLLGFLGKPGRGPWHQAGLQEREARGVG